MDFKGPTINGLHLNRFHVHKQHARRYLFLINAPHESIISIHTICEREMVTHDISE